jgi:hypothetical protein
MAAKKEIKFDQDQLHQMMVEVSGDLAEMLKAEQSALAKSAEDDEPGESSEGSGGPTEADGSAEGSAPPGGGPPEASAPPMEGSAPPAAASPPPAAPGPEASAMAPDQQQGAIEPAPTAEGLQQEYMQLGQQDPEALKMHFVACKAAMMAMMGAQQPAAPAAPPEASAPAAPPAAAAAPPVPPMGKTETGKKVPSAEANGGQMNKAEKEELDQLKATVAEQGKLLKAYDEELGKFAKVAETALQPVRKSVKNASDMKFIGRTDDVAADKPDVSGLSRKDVQGKLSAKIREGKLAKNDSELIYQYNIGKVGVDKIAHLLVDAAK